MSTHELDTSRELLRQKVKRHPDERLPGDEDALSVLTQWQLVWRRFKKSKLGFAGGIIVILLYLSAIFAGFLAPYSYRTPHINAVHAPPQLPKIWDEGPRWPFVYDFKVTYSENGLERVYRLDKSERHPIKFFVRGDEYEFLGLFDTTIHLFGTEGMNWFPLGTDRMGRDVLSRLLVGGRVSLTIGLVGVAISMILGALIGTISGYFGGFLDTIIQRFIELLMTFPTIPLWMALAAALPPQWGPLKVYFGIVTILSLIGWGGLARQIRGMVLSYRESDYVKSARSFGASDKYVILRHLMPACSGHLIVIATLAIPATILGETALSFLGFGIRSPMTSWGVMLEEAQHVRVLIQFPWLLLPVVPVLLTVVAFNFLGDALRDATNPEGS